MIHVARPFLHGRVPGVRDTIRVDLLCPLHPWPSPTAHVVEAQRRRIDAAYSSIPSSSAFRLMYVRTCSLSVSRSGNAGTSSARTSLPGANSSAKCPSISFLSVSAPAFMRAIAASPVVVSVRTILLFTSPAKERVEGRTMPLGNCMMQRGLPGAVGCVQRAPMLQQQGDHGH